VAAFVAAIVTMVEFFGLRERFLGEETQGSIAFTEPIPEQDHQASSRILTVRGTVQSAPNRNLWIVVRDDTSGGGYYPQGLARIAPNGTWECDISLGSKQTMTTDHTQY
jgi:hypothetical protein